VDLPRLQDGNVALQVFGVVTGFPLFPAWTTTRNSSDAVATLAKLQEWPNEATQAVLKRPLQAKKLADRVIASQGG